MNRYFCSITLFVSLSGFSILGGGCSSAPTTTAYEPDRVVGRVDGRSDRPEWAKESQTVIDKGEKYWMVGLVEVPGDSRPTAAFKASDVQAKGALASKVESRITKVVESADTGFSMEDQRLTALVREVSRTAFRNIEIKERYWEKVDRTKSDRSHELVLKAFSLLEIEKSEVKKLIEDSIKSARTPASREITNGVEKAIQRNWEKIEFPD